MAIFCPSCSEEITPETTKCPSCGTKYDADTVKFLKNLSQRVSKGYLGELRKQARMPLTFKVAYSTPKEFSESYTFDLSLGGVFVKTDNPLRPGEIITLKIFLPGEEKELEVSGEVAWASKKENVMAGKKLPPGMGIKFLDPSEEIRKKIINILRESLAAGEESAIIFCPSCTKEIPPETTECPLCGFSFGPETLTDLVDIEAIHYEDTKNRREYVRVSRKFKITYFTTKDLINSYIFDISPGGVFIKTDTPLSPGEIITLKIFLPDKGKELEILGEVIWSHIHERITPARRYPPGMGVKFLKLSTKDKIRISMNILKHY